LSNNDTAAFATNSTKNHPYNTTATIKNTTTKSMSFITSKHNLHQQQQQQQQQK
jgi:hypothetical protein